MFAEFKTVVGPYIIKMCVVILITENGVKCVPLRSMAFKNLNITRYNNMGAETLIWFQTFIHSFKLVLTGLTVPLKGKCPLEKDSGESLHPHLPSPFTGDICFPNGPNEKRMQSPGVTHGCCKPRPRLFYG